MAKIINAKKKFFGTDGIRGPISSKTSPDFILKLGWAAGEVFKDHGISSFIIGKDTRISGYMLEAALQAGIISSGLNVRLVGPLPTPAISYLVSTFKSQAGIVISASHNSYEDHGIKFFETFGNLAYINFCHASALRDLGATMSPFNAYLTLTGIETLNLRMQKHMSNADEVANFLIKHDKVDSVSWSGFQKNKSYKFLLKIIIKLNFINF